MKKNTTNKTVVIIANSSSGLYGFRGELIQEIIKQGYRVIALTPFNGKINDLELLGVEVRQISMERRGISLFKDIKLLYHYYRHLEQLTPDLIITYTIKPNIYGGMLARWMKIPYATNITGLGTAFQNDGLLKQIVVFLYRIALKKAKVVFFENIENMETIINHKIIKKIQSCLLYGAGVNLEKYRFCQYPETDEIRFLFIGRIMKEKGIDELFEVAQRIRKENPYVFFDIVGPMEDDYKERVSTLVNEGVINYYGYQEDVRPFIRECHCFVLPSYHEGMANTLLESAAMGRPLITSDIHGCKEAVIENVSGYLCKKKNPDALYQKLKKFMVLTYDERQKMGLASRKHMEQLFDKKKVVKETVKRMQV